MLVAGTNMAATGQTTNFLSLFFYVDTYDNMLTMIEYIGFIYFTDFLHLSQVVNVSIHKVIISIDLNLSN